MKSSLILASLVLHNASAFSQVTTSSKRTCTSLSSKGRSSFIPDLSDIAKPFEGFFGGSRSDQSSPDETQVSFSATPEGLVTRAKRVLNSDLGLQDQSLLDDEKFQWVSPTVDKPLDKTDYLAAGRFFDLRSAFPDLSYRAHDFRIDPDDDQTVRFTCRITGTMRGALRLRDVILSPTGKTMICPPEGFSMTFDPESGNLVKLCTGFALDRLVGNTEGTTGVVAAALIGGQPISDWEIYPPATVFKRFFGRPIRPLPEVTNFLAPFPETVMIQLAKGIISSNMASVDPSLLAQSFTYMTPSLGPIGKKEFLEKYAKEEFQDVDPRVSNYRVDPYDPERVWVDLKPLGAGYQGAPQAMSFAFDGDGFCTRVTAGAVLDPTTGNGGGLGGSEGLRYARGQASNPLTTRPLPRLLARLKNDALAPLSGVTQKASTARTSLEPKLPPTPPQTARQAASSEAQEKQLTPLEKLTASVGGSINLANIVKENQPASPMSKPSQAKSPSSKSFPVIKPPSTPPKSPPQVNKSRLTPPPASKSTISWPTKSLTSSLGSISIRKPPVPTTTPSKGASSISNKADKVLQANKQKQEQKRNEATEAARKQMQAKAAKEAEATRKRDEARKADIAKKEFQQKKDAEAKAKQDQVKREQDAARERLAAENKAKREREAANRDLEKNKQAEAQQEKKAAAAKEIEQKRRQEDSLASLSKAASRATVSLFGRQDTPAATVSESVQLDRQRRDAEKDQQEREEAALATLAKAASRATINLLGLKNFDKEPLPSSQKAGGKPVAPPKGLVPRSKAPAGVPTLSRWRENPDGSVTGNVSGSRSFTNGEKITTSKIVKGIFASGEVVVTGSNSRYFLN